MYKRIAYIVLIGCLFIGCTTYQNYSDKLKKVNVGMTKIEVLNLMGNPNDKQVDNYGDEAWLYGTRVWDPSKGYMDICTLVMFYNDKVTEISSDKKMIHMENAPGFIEAKRTEDEAKAKEFGYPSVEAYNEAIKRQSFGNLMTLLLYNKGIPFSKGDIITVPAGMLVGIDRKNDGKKINYLVQITGNPDSRAIYTVSTRELQIYGNVIREPLKLKYIQPVQYKEGLQIINSWAFEIIK
jgi:outer membrane protein assembly factor BamE (lipoprotein component of BamABCDE complex)